VPIYNTCAGYGHIRATKRNALFERTEDWSLKAGAATEGLRICSPGASTPARRPQPCRRRDRRMKIWPFDIAAEASMAPDQQCRDRQGA
jgi:hypothetical protein